MLRVLVALLLTGIVLQPWSGHSEENGWARFVVVLGDNGSVSCGQGGGTCQSSRGLAEAYLQSLGFRGIPFRTISVLTNVVKGVVIDAPEWYYEALASYPGAEVFRDDVLEPYLDRSGIWVGAKDARLVKDSQGRGLTGLGVRVAVIDTGVDYTHPDLGGRMGKKIVSGFDFVDEDSDPMDMDGHGTGVAGVIASNGSLVGIAPEVDLLAYRVVGKSGLVRASNVVRALDLADKEGAKVINLSLGGITGSDVVQKALRNLARKGIVVVVAAGNSGPSRSTIGALASTEDVITVGASLNNVSTSLSSELSVRGTNLSLASHPLRGSPTDREVRGPLVFAGYGSLEELEGKDVRNAIVLVERGPPSNLFYFSTKEKNAASKGAAALIIHNYDDNLFTGTLTGSHNPPNYQPTVPVVSTSGKDGRTLRELANRGRVEVALKISMSPDIVAPFSSRGPTDSFQAKPDIVAPGDTINSTQLGGQYRVFSGTSFAAPHVSGAVALLLQQRPGLKPSEALSILTSTARPMSSNGQLFSVFDQGSGRLDVYSSLVSPLIPTPSRLIFQIGEKGSTTETLELMATRNESQQVSATLTWPHGDKVDISLSPMVTSVRQGASSAIKITARALGSARGLFEGRISIRTSEPFVNLTIPVIVNINNATLAVRSSQSTLKVSITSPTDFGEALIKIRSPDGFLRELKVKPPEKSASVDIKDAGKYWVEAEVRDQRGIYVGRTVAMVSETGEPRFEVLPPRVAVEVLVVVGIASLLALASAFHRRRRLRRQTGSSTGVL